MILFTELIPHVIQAKWNMRSEQLSAIPQWAGVGWLQILEMIFLKTSSLTELAFRQCYKGKITCTHTYRRFIFIFRDKEQVIQPSIQWLWLQREEPKSTGKQIYPVLLKVGWTGWRKLSPLWAQGMTAGMLPPCVMVWLFSKANANGKTERKVFQSRDARCLSLD